MALETVAHIADLVVTNPTSSDPKSQGDDHLRNLKIALKTDLPNITGPVTSSHAELNYMVGVTSLVQTQLNTKGAIAGQTWTGTHDFTGATEIKVPAPTVAADAVNKAYADAIPFGGVNPMPSAAAGGAADAITATFSPVIALVDQQKCMVVCAGANTSATPTFAPNGLAAHTITMNGGQPLVPGSIPAANFVAILEYNLANTRWELLNPRSLPIINGFISGFTLSNDGGTPNSILDIAAGYAADSTNGFMITGTAFTKSTAGTWAAGTGGNGMGAGLTVANSTWYHAFAIINAGAFDVYFDTSTSAANKPANTTAFRYIGSFKTDGSAHIVAFTQTGNKFIWHTAITDMVSGVSTTNAAVTLTTPLGLVVNALLAVFFANNFASNNQMWLASGTNTWDEATLQVTGDGSHGAINVPVANISTNTSSQISYRVSSGCTGQILTYGYVNPHVAAIF